MTPIRAAKRYISSYLLFFVMFICNNLMAQTDAVSGKQIFTSRCASCHSVAKQATGPALKDVDKRHTEEWIIKFVHSSQTVVKAGDTSATRLFAQFNNTIMPDHPDLSNADIKNIVAFIREESVKIASAPSTPPVPDNEKAYLGKSSLLHQAIYLDIDGNHQPLKFDSPLILILFAAAFAVLLWAMLLLVKVKDMTAKEDSED